MVISLQSRILRKPRLVRVLGSFTFGGSGGIDQSCETQWNPSERLADRAVLRSGFVEGNKVQDIVLDTGCSRTMIRSDLVPTTKLLDNAVMVQCAYGDTVAYPLAVVELTVDGLSLTVEAALLDT